MLLVLGACTRSGGDRSIEINWQPMSSVNGALPDGIGVYEGNDPKVPLRAWYVKVNEPDPNIWTDVIVADDIDGMATVSSMASALKARVVINGGFYRRDLNPARHVGLLKNDGVIIQPSISAVTRDEKLFPLARAALGITKDDRIDIAWTYNRGDSMIAIDEPLRNRPNAPDTVFNRATDGSNWDVHEAIGGGPALIVDGGINVTADEEVFFGTSIPNIHPRTACGYTSDGSLIIMVVDGRQDESRGVNLEELAGLLLDVGCVEALNLDGGGSSTLVVDGQLINRPQGNTEEREVMSALAVFSK